MRAISAFSRDPGMSTRVCLALTAFRIRVSMSEIGSVISSAFGSQLSSRTLGSTRRRPPRWQTRRRSRRSRLPAALRHAGDVALQGELAEAQTAQRELPHVAARPSAQAAAIAQPDLELRRLLF